MVEHLLVEHIAGYELFELKGFETLAQPLYTEYAALTQIVNHISSLAFTDVSEAVSSIKSLERGDIPEKLKIFLEMSSVKVLHCDKSLKNALKTVGIEQKYSPNIVRGVKVNLSKFTRQAGDKQLRMGAAFCLAKENIQYNLEREDNVAVSVGYEIENVEKDIENLKEKATKLLNWYFPSLNVTVNSDVFYSLIFNHINNARNTDSGTDDIVDGAVVSKDVSECVGIIKDGLNDIPEFDISILKDYLSMIFEKEKLLRNLEEYLAEKMKILAPNLRHILGDKLCFKMIHKAGGLMNLSLYPSSTLQLLGAEKSLFRSLKMRTNTPKYGLIYQLNYLHRSGCLGGNIGRMCRFIAAKCSVAARIDCFCEDRSGEYGKELKKLIDKKIQSYKSRKIEIETTAETMKRVEKRLKEANKK
ncbi:uncharacterized protein VICG_01291 [Vittaforma corneae ATCC 50505]|uniref:Nop domain-containing protein n=1 Tax=Vittaforma corneae (strain ATCC 50505) TaxID=993615 RepID=L2GLA9_VITCO|nr:uncharacterized protein VICG_01291 [Vittaforma corneae ATCC 50505]ELA41658.1 hypothetical protein VICG_01291 [Vittaforma corneae ATCC 50505]